MECWTKCIPLVVTWAAVQSIVVLPTMSPQFRPNYMQNSLDHASGGTVQPKLSGLSEPEYKQPRI